MPPRTPEDRLLDLTNAEQSRIYRLLADAQIEVTQKLNAALDAENEGTARKLAAILVEIKATLETLDGAVKDWSKESTRTVYEGAMEVSDDRLSKVLGATIKGQVGFDAPIHLESINLLAEAAYSPFRDHITRIGRRVDDDFQRAQVQAARSALVGADTAQSMARNLRATLGEQGLFFFEDRSGRAWDLRRYSEMASRTILRECETQATANRLAQCGVHLGEVSYHVTAQGPCDICGPWQGKLLDLDGSSNGAYPTVDEARAGGLWHPNCRHNLIPHVPDIDDQIEALKEQLGEGSVKKNPKTEPVPVAKIEPKPVDGDPIQAIRAESATLQGLMGDDPEAYNRKKADLERMKVAQAKAVQDVQFHEGRVKSARLMAKDARTDQDRKWFEDSARNAEHNLAGAQKTLENLAGKAEAIQAELDQMKAPDYTAAEVQARRIGHMVEVEAQKRGAALGPEIEAARARLKAIDDEQSKAGGGKVLAAKTALDDHQAKMRAVLGKHPEYDDWMTEKKRLQQEYLKTMTDADYGGIQDRRRVAQAELDDLIRQKSLKRYEVLGEVRTFGADESHIPWDNTTKPVRKVVLDTIAPFYPRSWWQKGGLIRYTQISGRCFYRGSERWARIGKTNRSANGGNAGVHETAHHWQNTIPGFFDIEEAFYNRRCSRPDGTLEPLVSLRSLTGGRGYGPRERARKDRWPEPYMGKSYAGDVSGRYLEVLTCAFDDMALGKAAWLTDPDQADLLEFSLGILAGVG